MSSEREIVQRLFESTHLDEASFEYNGKRFSSAFGRYSCDGEAISREDYIKASELAGEDPEAGSKVNPYEQYKPEDFDNSLDSFEDAISDIADQMRDVHYQERDELEGKLDDIAHVLSSMEEYLSDEQYERSDELLSQISKAKDTEYEGPSRPEYDDPYQSRGLRQSDFY